MRRSPATASPGIRTGRLRPRPCCGSGAEDRVREERERGPRDGAYAVRDGAVWWSWDQSTGATTNQDDPKVRFSVGDEVSLMLDPTPLLESLRFTPAGRGCVAGRSTLTADAVPRLSAARQHPRAFELARVCDDA